MARRKRSKASLAALKGWRTREKNKRSLAAKKGWKTRRANQKRKAVRRKTEEFVIRFSYTFEGDKHDKKAITIRVEVHVKGPARSSRDTIIALARERGEIIWWEKTYIESGKTKRYEGHADIAERVVAEGVPESRDRSNKKL